MKNQQAFPSPQNILRQLANCLRTAYWTRRNLTYGQGDDEIWFELARSLTSRIVPMDLFVESQFYTSKKRYRPPSPRELLGKKAYDCYEKYREREAKRIEAKITSNLRFQQENLKIGETVNMQISGNTKASAILQTLVLEHYNFTQLFCYTQVSQTKELANGTQRYFLNAVLEYVPLREVYDKVWGNYLPKDFPDLALNTYCKLFAPDLTAT